MRPIKLGRWLRCSLVCLLHLSLAFAQDWPEFRGPNRSGASAATGLPVHFNPRTNVAWVADVPMSRSSVVVKDGRLFLTAADQDNLMLFAFDSRTGKSLWRYSMPRGRTNEIDAQRNDPASPTPAVDGESVYAFFQDFGLLALTVQGKELWKLPLGPFPNNYGMGSSPIVHRETVFLQCDMRRASFIVAVDKRTGKVRWRTSRPSVLEGWTTPLILPESGELVASSSNGVETLDVETGKVRWSLPGNDGIMIPTPTTDGKRLIATIRGSDQPTFPSWAETVKELDADKDGRLSPTEISKRYNVGSFGLVDTNRDGYIVEEEWNVFRNRGVGEFGFTAINLKDKSVMWRYTRSLPYVPSPVLYRDVLYSVRSGGIVTAVDAVTGRLLKEGRAADAVGEYFSSPVAADGMVYLASFEGKVSVLKAALEWEVLGVNDLDDDISASPIIADGAIFVRTHSRLYCFRQR